MPAQGRRVSWWLAVRPGDVGLAGGDGRAEEFEEAPRRLAARLEGCLGSCCLTERLPGPREEGFGLLLGKGLDLDGKLAEQLQPEVKVRHDARCALVLV